MTALLDCEHLEVRFHTEDGEVCAVNDLNLQIQPGECLGIVGESGSGKSQSVLAMLGLLADNGTASGSVRYRGRDILNLPRTELDQLRGDRLAMVFQDALSGLTPTMRIGEQLTESLRRHRGLSRAAAKAKVLEILEIVKIPAPETRYKAYPFELSGGMRQRVMIAMAMLCQPELLICDEPTTALDVTVQAQILRLLDGLKRHTGTAIILITHDLGVVAGLCDKVLIMYAGRAVETGTTHDIFNNPRHPYTAGLLRSVPCLSDDVSADLPTIPGQPPNLEVLPPGCAFAPRCEQAIAACQASAPGMLSVGSGHAAACHRIESA
ncbi:MAG: ABC transporter ATP-binding protein [Gammaproteobacteria bacterium]